MAGTSKGFRCFLAAQATSSFNDNAFKSFVILSVIAANSAGAPEFIALAGCAFIVPFLLFSTLAGDVADRWPKSRLTTIYKAIEVALLLLAAPALAARGTPALLGLLCLMGAHSAFFGPVKLRRLEGL